MVLLLVIVGLLIAICFNIYLRNRKRAQTEDMQEWKREQYIKFLETLNAARDHYKDTEEKKD